MNAYAKYAPNVFLAKCTDKHEKGEVISVTTQYGKENESIVFNLIIEKDAHYYYSIVRADGFDARQWALKRADRFKKASENSNKKSDEFYNKSNKDKDFLVLAEPIKIGHHSERRHRKAIECAQNNMRNSFEMSKKSDEQLEKSSYWESRASDINLSMPESIEYFEFKLNEAQAAFDGIKNGSIEKRHAYSLVYARKHLKEISKKYDIAKKLWS